MKAFAPRDRMALAPQLLKRAPAAMPAGDRAPESRFGEAAHLVDRMDLRPLELRRRARPWWRLIG